MAPFRGLSLPNKKKEKRDKTGIECIDQNMLQPVISANMTTHYKIQI